VWAFGNRRTGTTSASDACLETFEKPLPPGNTPKNQAPTADKRTDTGVRRERLPSFRKASNPVKAQAAPEERRVDLAELSARANAEPGSF
jgi:hypothetical protein